MWLWMMTRFSALSPSQHLKSKLPPCRQRSAGGFRATRYPCCVLRDSLSMNARKVKGLGSGYCNSRWRWRVKPLIVSAALVLSWTRNRKPCLFISAMDLSLSPLSKGLAVTALITFQCSCPCRRSLIKDEPNSLTDSATSRTVSQGDIDTLSAWSLIEQDTAGRISAPYRELVVEVKCPVAKAA